jgi:very-short-patch-repair endonuclease
MANTKIAQKLRRDQTQAERKFWTVLESYRTSGWHLRRQSPIGPYVVDFVCKQAGVIFEIDGDSHHTDPGISADLVRTAYLESRGCYLVRFTNLDVMSNPEGVWQAVGSALAKSKNTPT